MAKALCQPPGRMTVDQFLAWLDEGPEGVRYELVAGEVVAMAPERAAQGGDLAGFAREHPVD
jgi:Uma2 family endonuclease